jgi:N-acetylmuramoyl-L-alanine amidase
MLIKPFRSIESAATATHNWRRRQILRAGASTLVLGLVAPRRARIFGARRARLARARLHARHDRIRSAAAEQPAAAAGPDRLVVDLNGLDLDQALRDLVSKIAPNDPQIQSVRVGQYQPHVVRMVFDLKGR